MQDAFGPTTPQRLVQVFCEYLWSGRFIETAEHLLADDFVFRSASDRHVFGREQFVDHLRHSRSLTEQRYEVLECICEASRVFARVRVSDVGNGSAVTVMRVGAALFRCELETVNVEWMLGDLGGADPFFYFVRNRIKEVWVSEELAARPPREGT